MLIPHLRRHNAKSTNLNNTEVSERGKSAIFEARSSLKESESLRGSEAETKEISGGLFGSSGIELREDRELGGHLLVLEVGEEGAVGGLIGGDTIGFHGVEEGAKVFNVILVGAENAEHEVVGQGERLEAIIGDALVEKG